MFNLHSGKRSIAGIAYVRTESTMRMSGTMRSESNKSGENSAARLGTDIVGASDGKCGDSLQSGNK
jgi:hypothetical protein